MALATAPPTPRSTSSKIIVAAVPASASATFSARMKRDSSPPDAIRVSGPNGAPGLVETSNSTRSVPAGPASAGGDRGAEARRVELQRRKLAGDGGVEALAAAAPRLLSAAAASA